MRDTPMIRFIKALVAGETPVITSARSGILCGGVTASRAKLVLLAAERVISLAEGTCAPGPLARDWLRRRLAEMPDDAAPSINLDESPLARLATAKVGEMPFLDVHQVEAGERVRRLFEQAHLQPRLTMSYSAGHTRSRNRPHTAADIGDRASAARRALRTIHTLLPADCAGVVLDVCGYLKGLQVVEQERGWPRRSAKLVLRIGLEQLAQHFGYGPGATGRPNARMQGWLEEGARPLRFE